METPTRSLLRHMGSLWLASTLMLVLMVAMASGTILESTAGRERAMLECYQAPWFRLLLALFAVNLLARLALMATDLRGHKLAFLTHAGLLVVLLGAWVTERFGETGTLSIFEGATVSSFDGTGDALVLEEVGGSLVDMGLDPRLSASLAPLDRPGSRTDGPGGLTLEVLRYAPDLVDLVDVRVGGSADPPAVELIVEQDGRGETAWVFTGEPVPIGTTQAVVVEVDDRAYLERLRRDASAGDGLGIGTLVIQHEGRTHELDVEACLEAAQPLEGTGLTARVAQYLPHAVQGADGDVANASNRAVNPALALEVRGEGILDTRFVFAHGAPTVQRSARAVRGLEAAFRSPAPVPAAAPVELLVGPGSELHVRFQWEGAEMVVVSVRPDEAVETPWPGGSVRLGRVLEHARTSVTAGEPPTPRAERRPALLARLSAGGESRELWLQRGLPEEFSLAGTSYAVRYGSAQQPLGFEVGLDDFRLGRYPGGQQIRSYESHLRFRGEGLDDASAVVGMNRPFSYGGYTFFQSGYDEVAGVEVTHLEVGRDPGQWLVFLGYALASLGLVLRFTTHARARGLRRQDPTAGPSGQEAV